MEEALNYFIQVDALLLQTESSRVEMKASPAELPHKSFGNFAKSSYVWNDQEKCISISVLAANGAHLILFIAY